MFVTGVKLKTKDVIDTLKTEVYTPETPCMKRTSVHIKNTANKTVMCYHKVRDFATAFGCENVSGPLRNWPLGAGRDSLGTRLLIPPFQIKIFCSSSRVT